MASKRIAGITIEIGGDTTQLNKSLQGVDKQLATTKASLRDVEKLLKLNPATVRKRISRGKEILREKLGKDYFT